MGTFISWPRLSLSLMAAGSLLLTSCWHRCEPSERTIALQAPYDRFFSGLPDCNSPHASAIAASTSTGLSDSFNGGCISRYTNSYTNSENCETTSSERRSTYHYAALYGFSFTLQIEQFPDGPLLVLRDQSAHSGVPTSELTYRFTAGTSDMSYYDATAGSTVAFEQHPVVTELTNFQSGSRTYAQVWRITNPLNAARGRATAATVVFIDRDYGLIRFEQRDGTVWTLAP